MKKNILKTFLLSTFLLSLSSKQVLSSNREDLKEEKNNFQENSYAIVKEDSDDSFVNPYYDIDDVLEKFREMEQVVKSLQLSKKEQAAQIAELKDNNALLNHKIQLLQASKENQIVEKKKIYVRTHIYGITFKEFLESQYKKQFDQYLGSHCRGEMHYDIYVNNPSFEDYNWHHRRWFHRVENEYHYTKQLPGQDPIEITKEEYESSALAFQKV